MRNYQDAHPSFSDRQQRLEDMIWASAYSSAYVAGVQSRAESGLYNESPEIRQELAECASQAADEVLSGYRNALPPTGATLESPEPPGSQEAPGAARIDSGASGENLPWGSNELP